MRRALERFLAWLDEPDADRARYLDDPDRRDAYLAGYAAGLRAAQYGRL